jgi:histidinol-phosphate aminotransferase
MPMSDTLPRPRDDLAGFGAYKTQQAASAEVRVNANEWAEPNRAGTYLTPEELHEVLLNRYPAAAGAAVLRATLATRFGVAPEQLIFGNGSNEVLLNTFLVFGGHGRTTLLFQPTYSMHERLAQIAGGTVANEEIGLPYDLTAKRAQAAMARTRPAIVCFTTPNNPTGNLIDHDLILAVAEAYPETLVLVDEAYSDFANTTILPRVVGHPNVVVSKTFSKARAAAGLRLGILIVDPRIADRFRAVQLPYNVSALTHAVGAKLAGLDDDIARRVEECRVGREIVYAALQMAPGVEPFPSITNFVLFRLADGDTAGTHARFVAEGILLRDISMWPGCAGCLRVSIGTPEENDKVAAAIGRVFAPPAKVTA